MRRALAGVLGLTLALAALASEQPGATDRLELNSTLSVRVVAGRDVVLEVRAGNGDTYDLLAARYAGSERQAPAIEAWNHGKPIAELERVEIPLALLRDEYRSLVLLNLFPNDTYDGKRWTHLAREGALPTYDEGMWQVAEWFVGRGSRYPELLEVNGLKTPELHDGQAIRIPQELLHRSLRAPDRSDDGSLVYDRDEHGPYAGYRLKAGEALYSAVVVRFTGRTSAEDVVALARDLAARSGIADLRDIPIGFLVKIPLDDLEPEFLPRSHPRRKEAEAARAELAESLADRPVPEAAGLRGVVLILDPGHGGKDLGTRHNGIWEHDYVYDVACRLKSVLERRSAAHVVMTLEDEKTGCRPSRSDALNANLEGTIRTTPPFLAKEPGDARIGVNLRWYLANSIFRHRVADGTDPNRVVFLSLHADARHPSLRGAMAYVPGARYVAGTHGHSGKPYSAYREVREKPTVRFSHKERVRSEAVSTKLAESLLAGMRRERLPVGEYKPVRDRIIRGRHNYFVPAVLRGNQVPAKVLVEMLNLANKDDAALLGSAQDRERLAVGIARGLFAYFGETAPESMSSSGTSR